MGHFKGVVKVTVYMDIEDVDEYADGLGEFQRLVENKFEQLEQLDGVNVVWADVGEMKIMDNRKLVKGMEDGESHESITLCNKKGKRVKVLDDGNA